MKAAPPTDHRPRPSGRWGTRNGVRPSTGQRIGYLMFLSRWSQVPLYAGLIVAQLAYVWVFMRELWHLAVTAFSSGLKEADIMLAVLGLVDVVMVANLLLMVIVGGYETFVARVDLTGHPDEPEWLSHVNANVLKVKLASAIIGISSIHLLRAFIEIGRSGWNPAQTQWQVLAHLTFLLSALALALLDRLMHRTQHARSSD